MVQEETVTIEDNPSTEEATPGAGESEEPKRDLSWQLERIWDEIKQISRQVEQETRRGGRIARLRFDIRGLRREVNEQCARLGQLVYEAQKSSDRRPTLARVEGYDDLVANIASIEAQIDDKEAQISELRAQGEPDTETV